MKRFSTLLVISILIACFQSSCLKAGDPVQYVAKVVAEYPHSTDNYTQGFFFYDGALMESNGGYGKSAFVKYADNWSEKPAKSLKFGKQYFMEGSCALNGKVYVLTWKNQVIFTYDASELKWLKSDKYAREGWGLTTDGKSLIASDGSSKLYYLDPSNGFKTTKTVNVTRSDRPVTYLNELEWIDGKIWANVYLRSWIAIINPSSGEVEGVVDCSELVKRCAPDVDLCLNGIAAQDGKIYITGKEWPLIFQIELVRK